MRLHYPVLRRHLLVHLVISVQWLSRSSLATRGVSPPEEYIVGILFAPISPYLRCLHLLRLKSLPPKNCHADQAEVLTAEELHADQDEELAAEELLTDELRSLLRM